MASIPDWANRHRHGKPTGRPDKNWGKPERTKPEGPTHPPSR